MSDTVINDDETLLKHFVCDCGDISHGMVVVLEGGNVIFDWYVVPMGIWTRLRRIFRLLIGREEYYREFILRKEDIADLIDLLEQANEGRK